MAKILRRKVGVKDLPPRYPTAKMKVPVYRDGTDRDRLSITQQVRDISEAQKARTAQIVLSKYEHLFHNIYDSVLITDMEGNILEVNARAEHNFVWNGQDLCTMNVIELISGADQELLQVVCDSINTEKYLVIEAICHRADESRFSAEIMINSINDMEGDMLCFFFRDVTLRKEAEEKLAQANTQLVETEKTKARLDTVSTLVHELNNPLQILTCMGETENNKELQVQVGRIIAVLEELHSAAQLQTVVDEQGETRYHLSTEARLANCDYGRFLVVDDEATLRQMFVDSVASAFPTVKVEAAEGGQQAVELFKHGHHGLIIMDASMPVMSGEEAYAEIEATCTNEGLKLPMFIFCTGFVPSDNIKAIVGDESRHVSIKKPFTMNALTTTVQERLALVANSNV